MTITYWTPFTAQSVTLLPNGTDDTANIKAALAAGLCLLGPGNFKYSATLTLGTSGAKLLGLSWGNTTLTALAGFAFDSSAAMINVTADHCEIGNFKHVGGPNSGSINSYVSNPAGNAIQLQPGAQYTDVHDLAFYSQNGQDLAYVGGAGAANIIGTMIRTIHQFQSKAGMSFTGSAGSNNNGQFQITDIQAGQISGHSLELIDIQDVSVKGYNDSVVGASGGSALHVRGICSAVRVLNCDLGQFPNTGGNLPTTPTVLIEDSGNGSPNGIYLDPIVIQQGVVGVRITGGANRVEISGGRIVQNQNQAIDNQGTGFGHLFQNIHFSGNGQAAGTTAEVVWSSTAAGKVKECRFDTPQGASAGQVANAATFTGGGTQIADDNWFAGAGFTAANIFGTAPALASRNRTFNPVGSNIPGGTPGVPASTGSTGTRAVDCQVALTAGSSTCTVAVGGVTLATVPTAGLFTFRVPRGTTVTLTYANAPSWVWIGE